MKTMPILTLVALLSIPATWMVAADERLNPDQLPPAVRKTLEANRDRGPVKEISRRTVGGRTAYYVEIEQNNAPNPRLLIAEDGTVLSDTSERMLVAGDVVVLPPEYGGSTSLDLGKLPAPVQRTVRKEARGREIGGIDRELWNGRPIYEIEFKQRGPNRQIHVTDDGTLLQDAGSEATLKSWFMGTQLEDLPPAVQQTVRREVKDGRIIDVDTKERSGQTFYKLEIRDTQGQATRYVFIAEDGSIVPEPSGK